MEKRPIQFKFKDTMKNDILNMKNRRESMWKLMMKNAEQRTTKLNGMMIENKGIKKDIIYNKRKKPLTINTNTNVSSKSDLLGDMFVRHHSPQYKRNDKKKTFSFTTDQIDMELQSPSKRNAKKANKAKSKFGGAAFVCLMRAKLRIKQKKALQKLKAEMLITFENNTPSMVHPDEYIKPLSKKSVENQTKISECLSELGRKRMRILTYIFKHIDFEKIGEISFDSVMQFDLLLLPHATKQMILEDAELFFSFGGLKERPYMNMLDWLMTWKLAVEKSGSFKVIDNFFDQYFDTFRHAKFRLSVIGITWH
eukprot:97442_1